MANVDIKISPENLLPWSHMEDWVDGASAAPTEHTLAGTGAAVAREATTIKTGTYSAKVTFGSADATLSYSLPSFADYKGRKMTFGAWVNTATGSLGKLRIDDGVGTTDSSAHTGGGDWEFLTVTRNIDASATELTVIFFVDVAGFAFFDGGILIEGPTTYTILTDNMDVGRWATATKYKGQIFQVARRQGKIMPQNNADSMTLALEGMINSATATATRTKFDTIMKAVNSIRIKPDGTNDREKRDLYLFDDRLLKVFTNNNDPKFRSALRLQDIKLRFIVPDPFFQAVNKTRTSQDVSSSPATFTVTNGGSAFTRPIITISATGGSITSLTVENMTTGQQFSYTGTITTGTSVVIDTDLLTIENDGTGDIANMTGQLDMYLLPGGNEIKVTTNANGDTALVDAFDRWF